jgi:hypothetical protein
VRAGSIWQSVVEHAPEERRLVLPVADGRAPVERYCCAWNVMRRASRKQTEVVWNSPAKGGLGVRYLGIDWGYRRAAFCALSEGGAISGEGFIPADEDGLTKLVLACGTEVKACVEMMCGSVWVRDGGLAGAGRARAQGARRRAAGLQHR